MPSIITRVPLSALSTLPDGVMCSNVLSKGPSPRPKTEMISPGTRGPGKRLPLFKSDVMIGAVAVNAGGAIDETVSVTPTICDDPLTAENVAMVMTPEYVPAGNPVGLAETLSVAGAVPTVVLTESQPLALAVIALKARLAPDRESVWTAGFTPPI